MARRSTLSMGSALLISSLLLGAPAAFAQTTTTGTSVNTTWNCTGSPCPWGSSLSGHALSWPGSGTSARFGYTTSAPVYLPDTLGNGTIVKLTSGSASIFAGLPSAPSHRLIGNLSANGTLTVSGLTTGEVLSVQADGAFGYQITVPPPPVTPPPPPPPTGTPSQVVTWSCTSSPCPWGSSFTGNALVWPAAGTPTTARQGYTTSGGVYLPKTYANNTKIDITSGWATVFAGTPNGGSHRILATVSEGQSFTVTGIVSGEVVSVQSDYDFRFVVTLGTANPDPPPSGTASQVVTWNCTASPCPWGPSESGIALVWPTAANATSIRLGYTTSKAIYLPYDRANGAVLTLTSGTATAYAGLPGASSQRVITTLSAGGSFTFSGLTSGEVLSIQSGASFNYTVTVPDAPTAPPPTTGATQSVPAVWRCTNPGCGEDWVSQVINWPSWAAYSTNARDGWLSRETFNPYTNQRLYPYMGSWATGCKLTVVSGEVLVIEWERGTNNYRETWVSVGQTYTINLVPPENGAMIESYDYSPGFSVKLENCNPQVVPQ